MHKEADKDHYIEIINSAGWREGWRKIFPLPDDAMYIGAHPQNQVQLESDGVVEPRHLLIRPSADDPFRCVLYNLSRTEVLYAPSGRDAATAEPLPTNKPQPLNDEDQVWFGAYRLVYHGNRQLRRLQLRLRLPHGNLLRLNQPLDGEILIDYGDDAFQIASYLNGQQTTIQPQDAAQFTVELLKPHLPDKYFKVLNPGAVVLPNSREGIVKRVQLRHPQQAQPLAGKQEFIFRVTPDRDPAEYGLITKTIEVEPYYAHRLLIAPERETPATYRLIRKTNFWRRTLQRFFKRTAPKQP